MLNCDDLRNAVAVVQTTRKQLSSAHNNNLKTQSHGLTTNAKESNAAAKTVFQCRACQKEFVTEKYLCMHMALHRTTQAANNVVASSSSTPVNGAKLDNLKGGTITQLSSDDSIKLVKSDGAGGSHWTCKLCGKTFAQSSNYKNHIRTHSDERPFVCNICCIGFKERYHLKKHILFKHSDELKEECRVCGKRFKDSTAVRAHERIHSEERPYGCQRCDKTFKTSECLWHHENRSRTCGKSLNKASMDSNNGAIVVNPGPPRFRRGRHPSKRLAPLGKAKTVAETDDDAGLKIDHVEEISASVKIELEREIPDYYFKPLPAGLCSSYDFENMMDMLHHSEASLTIGREMAAFPKTQQQQSAKSADGHEKAISEFSGAEVSNACRSLGGIVTTNAKCLDQFSAPSYWTNEWTSQSSSSSSISTAGVLLESPLSRPATGVASAYDMIDDAYHHCTETHKNSWRQDASTYHALYAGKTAKSDDVASSKSSLQVNLSHYASHENVCHVHLSSAAAPTDAVSSAAAAAAATLPFVDLVKLGHHATSTTTTTTNSDDPLGSVSTQQVMQQQVQQVMQRTLCCSYAGDYRSNDKKAIRSMMSLTEAPWRPGTRSMEPASAAASATRALDGGQEFSTASGAPTGSSGPVSMASVPTAVVAPFKRENAIRPLDVSVSSAEMDQPPSCNSLPPFETFAPITLRVQKSQQQAVMMPVAAAVCTSADARPLSSTYAAGLYRFDGSAADRCPTIQKYLLAGGGHPKASVRINQGLSSGAQGQRDSLSNSHCYSGRLSPPRSSGRRHPDLFSSSLVPLDAAEHSFVSAGRHQVPEFRGFVPDAQMKMSGGGAQRELVVLPPPKRPSDVGFFQMTPGPDSQSAIFQSLNDFADSTAAATAAALSVNLYQQI